MFAAFVGEVTGCRYAWLVSLAGMVTFYEDCPASVDANTPRGRHDTTPMSQAKRDVAWCWHRAVFAAELLFRGLLESKRVANEWCLKGPTLR